MSSNRRPFTPEDVEILEEHEASLRELGWLVIELQDNLTSLREGLEECVVLLQPTQPASTLVLSTHRSECLKGYITRVGTQIIKGDMQLRLFGLPNTKGLNYFKLQLSAVDDEDTPQDRTLVLEQLVDCQRFVQEALKGLPTKTKDAKMLDDQLTMLIANIKAAKASLSGTSQAQKFPQHAFNPLVFDPPLPATLSFDISINEAAIIAEVRTLEPVHPNNSLPIAPAITSFGISERLAVAFGAKRPPHAGEEAGQIFVHRGVEVKVKERVRIESQDPSLMSVLAKLGALEHSLGFARRNLTIAIDAAGIK